MKKIALIYILSSLLIFNFLLLGEKKKNEQVSGKVFFSSSNSDLNRLFEWAKKQALAYAFSDDPVGLWYEASLPGREAFCMRDVSHQSLGAHILGLEQHTKNMLQKFAENISATKDWCSFWEIDRYGNPPFVDYYDEASFWYNLPANFDVLDCCYRMYLWTGDRTYIDDPVFINFYKRTVYDYVNRWDMSLEKIMKRPRIMNIEGKGDPKNRFQMARGIPGYDEEDPGFVLALDLIVVMQAGYNAYARMIKIHGDDGEAGEFQKRTQAVKSFIDTVWWNDKYQHYYTNLNQDYELKYFGPDHSIPYWNGTDDEVKMRAVVNELVIRVADTPADRVEFLSHLAEILYRYGEHQTAYDLLMRLMTSSRREYPEVSFTVVASLVNGLMGIELEVFPPEMALTWGGYVDRYITTLPRLTENTQWVEVKNLQIRKNDITIRHEGLRRTILTNNHGPSFIWKAKFPGSIETLLVNGRPVPADQEKLFAVDQQISWIRTIVGAGETIEVEVK